MNRQQYAEMLRHINQVRVERGNTNACIAEYIKRYKYVYVYNDSIFKKIFGNPENEKISCAFLNAVLKLDGPDCITKLNFVDPSVPGGAVCQDDYFGSGRERSAGRPHRY